jgi:hypothetical protein
MYVRMYAGYILRIRSDVVEATQTPLRAEKINKKENLIRSRFYGSVSLIAQLQYYKHSVTMVAIPRLQHI